MLPKKKQNVYCMLTFLWREKILGFLLDNPTAEIKVRDLARKLNLSPAYISKTLKILRGEKILKNNRVDLNSPIVSVKVPGLNL